MDPGSENALRTAGMQRMDRMMQGARGIDDVVDEQDIAIPDVTDDVHDLGLIQSPLKFRLYARFSGVHRKIQAGEFQLYGTMTPRQILNTLVEGRVRLYRVTIPEGYTLRQMPGM